MSARAPNRYSAALLEFKRRYWAAELERHGSVAAAARANGVSRGGLYVILCSIGIAWPSSTLPEDAVTPM